VPDTPWREVADGMTGRRFGAFSQVDVPLVDRVTS
jgi:hypothetical protein